MTTRITQLEDQKTKSAILRLEGTLTLEDAKLLERTCIELWKTGCSVALDLTGISFLPNQSAEILCALRACYDIELSGLHLFVQQIIEVTEEAQRDLKEREIQL